MARVNVRFRLPAAYCQHVFKLHFAAEQIQCAANCHIDRQMGNTLHRDTSAAELIDDIVVNFQSVCRA